MTIKLLLIYFFVLQVTIAQGIFRPIADGDIYVTGVVDQSGILIPGPTIHALIVFQAFSPVAHTQYLLTVNQYALPGGGKPIDIYGFASTNSAIIGADFDVGTYLGTISLPANMTFGQSFSLDVSTFILTSAGPYWNFNLRSAAGDSLSSLEQNYGTPPELVAFGPFSLSITQVGLDRITLS